MPLLAIILIAAGIFATPGIAFAPYAAHASVTAEQEEPSLATPLEAATTTTKKEIAQGTQYCSCVLYARALIPNLPRGNASDFKPNGPPQIDGLVLLDYDGVAHVAVITGFTADGIIVSEGNYHHCKKDTREIPLSDIHIRGFWHLP
jgi:hypothetical protein